MHDEPGKNASLSPACLKRDGISEACLRHAGISLVEILVSLSIFSIGIIGLYLSIQGMNKSLQVSMQRDVEAAYANMLISKVDPYNIRALNTSDLTDTNNKGSVSLPDNRTAYYLMEVRATATTADTREVNVYFYRNAADAASNPYRHFKRELPVDNNGYRMATGASLGGIKDSEGAIWTLTPPTQTFLLTADDYEPGLDTATTGAITSATAATCGDYHIANGTSKRLIYVIPVTASHRYTLELGFCEPSGTGVIAGQRVMEVLLNGTVTDTIDIASDAGTNTWLNKSYSITPVTQSGVSVIKLELRQKSGVGATQIPILERFRIIR